MTKREEIIALAQSVADKDTVDPLHNGFITLTPVELERFYHAAQRQAYERAEKAARDAWFQSTCHISDIEDAIRALIEWDR